MHATRVIAIDYRKEIRQKNKTQLLADGDEQENCIMKIASCSKKPQVNHF